MEPIPQSVDPAEFFRFLAQFNEYPTSGFQLAEAARARGFSQGLARFFESMPGRFANESEIMPYAEEEEKPPWGSALAISEDSPAPKAPSDTLEIKDITGK